MMKLVVDNAIPFIEGRLPNDIEFISLPGEDITREVIKNADGLIVRTRTRCDEQLLNSTDVKLVATATIGTDHIDMNWCEANGIEVRNAPGCNAPGVAQYVWASLFKTGFNPKKHIVGIIGYGHVGQIVSLWAKQMGITVLISDAPRKNDGFMDVDYVPMEEVLKQSDAVSIHVPFIKTGKFPTHNLIGNSELDIMKHGAILVNSSRGGVVDEIALKKAIKAGKVRGIIDVWENEPKIDLELSKLVEIATPHIAGYSEQGKKRATRMVLESVNEVLGIPVDLSGLECIPAGNRVISRALIENSYNPMIDTCALRSDINAFESLRNSYRYRSEPIFS